ncbi:MAG: HesA/MoeB/ThiF family protein [Bacteroidetes bacterium]|nr:HesA/MoeB/ThiF family protein [Bacteroidota bacterium]
MKMEPDFLDRYQRQIQLTEIGLQGQQKLRAARILVVGLGGLGCPVSQYLVMAGVGCIGLVDGDTVSLGNLQRQTLYRNDDVGKSKVQMALQQLQSLNPSLEVLVFDTALTPENSLDIVVLFDLVIDCTDNFKTRYLINDVCAQLNKSWVYGSVSRFEGQVAVFNVNIRKEGKAYSLNYRDVFPEMPKEGEVLACAETGVLGSVVGVVGSLQATEALKYFTGAGNLLCNQLLTYNALKQTLFTVKLSQ